MSRDKDYKGYKCQTCGWIWDDPYCDVCDKKLKASDRGNIKKW